MDFPPLFASRMKALLGEEYDAFRETVLFSEPVKGLRVNRNKLSPGEFSSLSPFPLRRIPYAEDGFYIGNESGAGRHPFHHAGAYYLQDPGAMATVAAIPEEILGQDRLRILDLCAAPGGKTTQLASAVGKNGLVVANECNAARSRVLRDNVERLGFDNICVLNVDTGYLSAWYPGYFDLVLVDAPCSGEGMFRKNEFASEDWSEGKVFHSAELQTGILNDAAACLRPGGYLLYSTCTYSREENEERVEEFLIRHPSFSLSPFREEVVSVTADGIPSSGSPVSGIELCRRFYPHRFPGEGQFMALLRRDGEDRVRGTVCRDSFLKPGKTDLCLVTDFLKQHLKNPPDEVGLCGGKAVSFPVRALTSFPVPPFGVVLLGATLGEARKGRFVPEHHLFTAYGSDFSETLELDTVGDSERILWYLRGEELAIPESYGGYLALLIGGEKKISLGGGKAVSGRLKNHYPKGLRVR